MKVTRTLVPMNPKQPMMRVTRVETEDGQSMTWYGRWYDDETAIDLAIDHLIAPEA